MQIVQKKHKITRRYDIAAILLATALPFATFSNKPEVYISAVAIMLASMIYAHVPAFLHIYKNCRN